MNIDYFVDGSFQLPLKKCRNCFQECNANEKHIYSHGMFPDVEYNSSLNLPENSLKFFIVCDNNRCKKIIIVEPREMPIIVVKRIYARPNSHYQRAMSRFCHCDPNRLRTGMLVSEKKIKYNNSFFYTFWNNDTDCQVICPSCKSKCHFPSKWLPQGVRNRIKKQQKKH